METEQLSTKDSIISSVKNVLSLQFLKSQEVKKFGTEPLVTLEKNVYKLNPEVIDSFKTPISPCSLRMLLRQDYIKQMIILKYLQSVKNILVVMSVNF